MPAQTYRLDFKPTNPALACTLPGGFEGTNLIPEGAAGDLNVGADAYLLASADEWTPESVGLPHYEQRRFQLIESDWDPTTVWPVPTPFCFLARSVALDFSSLPDGVAHSAQYVTLSVTVHLLHGLLGGLYPMDWLGEPLPGQYSGGLAATGLTFGWKEPFIVNAQAAGPLAGVHGGDGAATTSYKCLAISTAANPTYAATQTAPDYADADRKVATYAVIDDASVGPLFSEVLAAVRGKRSMGIQVGLKFTLATSNAFVIRVGGSVTNFGHPLSIDLTGSIDAVHVGIGYGASVDVTQAHHKQGGYWIGYSAPEGIRVLRAPHADMPLDKTFSVADGSDLAEPRLQVEPYSSLLSCVFRGGVGRAAGEPNDAAGGTLTRDNPHQAYRRFSMDDGETWTGDPPDIGDDIQPRIGMDGVKHIREVFSHRPGERLEFYNDANDVDADGNPTGKGRIQVRIYDISNTLVGTFPQDSDGNPAGGIGGLVADDTSFDALYVPDATTFLSCVFVVEAERKRFVSFDDGRTWLESVST